MTLTEEEGVKDDLKVDRRRLELENKGQKEQLKDHRVMHSLKVLHSATFRWTFLWELIRVKYVDVFVLEPGAGAIG